MTMRASPHRRARALALAAPLLAAGLGLAGCGMGGAAPEAPPAPEVSVAPPKVEDVQVFEEVVGRFRAIESVEVRPQITGRILRAHFADGEIVARGDPLFTIDAAQARARASEARAELELAEVELARAERLRALDAISVEEFDQRRSAVARLAAAASAAEVDVAYATVRAPIAGRVSDRRVDPGNVVQADVAVLTTIVSSGPIHFEFSMDPTLAATLARPTPGGRDGVEVFAQLEGETGFPHRGRLDFLDNQVDPAGGVVRGRAVFDNAAGTFTPGQFGRIRIARGAIEDALTVPEAAISSDQTRKLVLVVNEDEVVEPRIVELGVAIEGRRVVAGLEPGASVIVNGAGRVFPGMRVKPIPAGPELDAAAAPARDG